jgi:hypothetical protein
MAKNGCIVGLFENLLGKKDGKADVESLPFKGKDSIFSPAERSFYEVLLQAVGTDYTVFAKVRIIDLVYIQKGTEGRQIWLNKTQSKHVDFVLCEPKFLKPVIVVELDDASHSQPDREDRDNFVDAVMNVAKIRIIHIPVKGAYNVAQIAALIQPLSEGKR